MGRFLEIANRVVAEERRIETLDDLSGVQVKKDSGFSTAEKPKAESFVREDRQKIKTVPREPSPSLEG